jgi:hypothetical protein
MLGLFGLKSGKIGVYKADFIYQGPLKEDFSAGSPAINEVVLEAEFSEVRLIRVLGSPPIHKTLIIPARIMAPGVVPPDQWGQAELRMYGVPRSSHNPGPNTYECARLRTGAMRDIRRSV